MSEEKSLGELLAKISKQLEKIDPISIDEMPAVPLYMDQLTTFMDSKLRSALRAPKDDKVLTKTMINNYAKNDLIPPPLKKRYSKEHLYELLLIFYFKSFLSIGDIQTLLSPITADYFGQSKEKGYGIEDIYREILEIGKGARERLSDDLESMYKQVAESYDSVPEDKREYLRKFAFVCELSYDIYLKKFIVEQMIDEIAEDYVILHEHDDDLRKKAAKEATQGAMRIAKMKEEKNKASDKSKLEKRMRDKFSGSGRIKK